ncbi:MAG: hypothetical protein AMXMBFR13_29550 [Phycisphaerae bacterium]
MRLSAAVVGLMWMVLPVGAEPLTLPLNERPEWLARDGIVMAGSWEPLLFRVRRDGAEGYEPTASQRADYQREQSAETVAALKSLGVNFVMMHCYKGFGLTAEKESMADAVRFAKLCREAGLRVGVYNNSGTLGWELLFPELPQAREWTILDAAGRPRTYGRAAYRYYWNRNHPDAQAFHHGIVRFAVEDIRADLLHFDNYNAGPGTEAHSLARFREYLGRTFTPQQREKLGIGPLETVQCPAGRRVEGVLGRAWLDFTSQSLADSYLEIGRYARGLRKDILLELNPGGPGLRIDPPVDHGRMLPGGEAFWDEGQHPGFKDGRLVTRIRTYKVARRMENIAFAYTTNPLEAAEAMAFNLDCLGCIVWFEYGRLTAMPGSTDPVSPSLEPFVRFYQDHRDLFRDASVVAEVATLRSFPSQVYGDPSHARLTADVEQALIEHRVPFQIIYDCHLAELQRYRCLVLAGCVSLSEDQIGLIRRFVSDGGRVCMIGACGTHDEWLIQRDGDPWNDLPQEQVVRVDGAPGALQALDRACGGRRAFTVDAPAGVCAELTEQANRRLVHLVDYRPDGQLSDVRIRVGVPAGRQVRRVTIHTPGRPAAEPAFQQEGQVAFFSLPRAQVYAVAAVAWE